MGGVIEIGRWIGRGAILATVLQSVAPAPVGAMGLELRFRLVPEAAWNDGAYAASAVLAESRVELYRSGRVESELVAIDGASVTLPEGRWRWLGEGPGWVTVATGEVEVAAAPEGALEAHALAWPVVPACQIAAPDESIWRGVERIDYVSLDRHAVYPMARSQSRARFIPAGRYLAYSVGAGNLRSFSRVHACRPDLEMPFPALSVPVGRSRALVLHVELPDPALPIEPFFAWVESALPEPTLERVKPLGAVSAAGRLTYFFADLPAEGPLRARLTHPELRGRAVDLRGGPGGVEEARIDGLLPRVTWEIDLDFQPRRVHPAAQIELWRCRPPVQDLLASLDPRRCRPTGHATALLNEGRATYRFEALDGGWYVPVARIGRESIPGLGEDYSLVVDAGTEPVVRSPPLELRELEIYGHLLREREAVPGVVRLRDFYHGAAIGEFPTDVELFYRIHYFGDVQGKRLDGSPAPRGLRFRAQLEACDEEGFCRTFHPQTKLIGEGRMDLDLGPATELVVRVVDADSGEPVAGATVGWSLGGRPMGVLEFEQGESRWNRSDFIEAIIARSDAGGEVRWRGLPVGEILLSVSAEGFERAQARFQVERERPAERELALRRRREEGLEVLGPSGQPVAGAYVWRIDEAGRRLPGCEGLTSAAGRVRLAPACEPLTQVGAAHPTLGLQRAYVAGGGVEGSVTLGLPSMSARVIRFLWDDDRPAGGQPVALDLGGLRLGVDDLLRIQSRSGAIAEVQSGPDGRFQIPPLGPGLTLTAVASDAGGGGAPRWRQPETGVSGQLEVRLPAP